MKTRMFSGSLQTIGLALASFILIVLSGCKHSAGNTSMQYPDKLDVKSYRYTAFASSGKNKVAVIDGEIYEKGQYLMNSSSVIVDINSENVVAKESATNRIVLIPLAGQSN